MHIEFQLRQLRKRYPLAISRGVITGTENLFVLVEADGVTGIGEMAPSPLVGTASAREGMEMLRHFLQSDLTGRSIQEIWQLGRQHNVTPCALAALDIALWDQLARRAGLPLYRLLGLGRGTVPTSITVGMADPDTVRQRAEEMLARTGTRSLKVKLGGPEGPDADMDIYAAARDVARSAGAHLRADANGGWDVPTAQRMMQWLAQRDCEYIEQPLPRGAEEDLSVLYRDRPLPIFVDESCHVSSDVPLLADRVDGVNCKLMKCGGITEAMRIVAAAWAHGKKTMIGCMGESSVSIAAGAALAGLFDHIDLDSHFNLDPDPAEGLELCDGVVTPADRPGHGAWLKESNQD